MAGQGLGVTWPSRGGGHHVGHLCSGSPPTPGTSPQPTSALATSLGHGQLRVLPWSPAVSHLHAGAGPTQVRKCLWEV